MSDFKKCGCGLAMYIIVAGDELIHFCEDCDPHIVELVEDASP